MYIKLKNNIPENYSIAQLYQDNPNTSFPTEIPNTILAEFDVYRVAETALPTPSAGETVEDAGFVQREDGSWAKAWAVRAMTNAELEQVAQQKDEQRKRAYQNEADPLFFKWQRGEATQQQWLDKVAEIKNRI